MLEKPIIINQISRNRFNIYMLFTRSPIVNEFAQELEYYSNESSTILGIILIDKIDQDFIFVLLCRDENKQFRSFKVKVDIPTIEEARELITNSMKWHTSQNLVIVEQGVSNQGLNLFEIVVSEEKMHPYFTRLDRDTGFYPSKRVVIEVANHMNDIDGNFIEQFQSKNGFDARLWELYLFAFLCEEQFEIVRDYDRPDFVIKKDDFEIGVEAVIVSRKKENPPKYLTLDRKSILMKNSKEIQEEVKNDMPLRFGSTLFSKLSKEYWKLPHLKDRPLVFAIADFHDDKSMLWSHVSIIEYLYGIKQSIISMENDSYKVENQKIEFYIKKNGVKIPAGFFYQENVENVSGILFSATGTISKFTRMGVQAGFGNENQKILRFGDKIVLKEDFYSSERFVYEVSENCNEIWSEGVNLFHNPNAKKSIPIELFPNIAHHKILDGELQSIIPEFHPLSSINLNIEAKE